MTGPIDLAKIEQLLKSATNPRQKAMYQALLEKARRQQVTQPTKPAEPAEVTKPIEPAETIETTEASEASDPADSTEATAPDAIFQAVGMLKGLVNFSDDGNKATVKLSDKEYQLLWVSRRWRAYEALKKQIEATGNHLQRLVGH